MVSPALGQHRPRSGENPPIGAVQIPRATSVDHVRVFEDGSRIALEIEWNNKDPFFDRDLENFKRLHADGAISIGMIITRGQSLHENMRKLVRRFLDENEIRDLGALEAFGYEPTRRQKDAIAGRVQRSSIADAFRKAFTDTFVSDKFGEATTHWRKLEDRVKRGVGNPCPLVLIGLPDNVVTFQQRADVTSPFSPPSASSSPPGPAGPRA